MIIILIVGAAIWPAKVKEEARRIKKNGARRTALEGVIGTIAVLALLLWLAHKGIPVF